MPANEHGTCPICGALADQLCIDRKTGDVRDHFHKLRYTPLMDTATGRDYVIRRIPTRSIEPRSEFRVPSYLRGDADCFVADPTMAEVFEVSSDKRLVFLRDLLLSLADREPGYVFHAVDFGEAGLS